MQLPCRQYLTGTCTEKTVKLKICIHWSIRISGYSHFKAIANHVSTSKKLKKETCGDLGP